MSAGSALAAAMEELVAGARSARDGVFNSLDAVQRQTRGAGQALVAQIEAQVNEVSRRAAPHNMAAARDRDARFDPEDEWEVAGPDPIASGAAAGNTPVRDEGEDGDGYPQTWLR
jgi:hypothetical protein